jgi:DNA-binding winged helix-turn-helix (wHTH) protein
VGLRRSISFGSFCLDVDTRQLLQGPERRVVHLSPKAFALLCALVETRPRAMTKQELHQRLWPSTFVSEATLASLIAEVRAALGEGGRTPGFIRTLNGFGYRFEDASQRASEVDVPAPANWIIVEGREHRLADGVHVFGRGADVDVALPSPRVSHRHAQVVIDHDGATLADLQSKNGVYLRGRRITTTPVRLMDGDRIQMGGLEIVFRCETANGSTETQG